MMPAVDGFSDVGAQGQGHHGGVKVHHATYHQVRGNFFIEYAVNLYYGLFVDKLSL